MLQWHYSFLFLFFLFFFFLICCFMLFREVIIANMKSYNLLLLISRFNSIQFSTIFCLHITFSKTRTFYIFPMFFIQNKLFSSFSVGCACVSRNAWDIFHWRWRIVCVMLQNIFLHFHSFICHLLLVLKVEIPSYITSLILLLTRCIIFLRTDFEDD